MGLRKGVWAAGVFSLLLMSAGRPGDAGADETPARPEREVVVAFEYPRLEVEPQGSLTLNLVVKNNGRKDEIVVLDLAESPADLRSKLEEYGKVVGGLFVASGEKKTLSVSLKPKAAKEATPDAEKKPMIPPGAYKFAVKAATEDGKLSQTASAHLTVKSPTADGGEEPKDPVAITCSYPNLRGANDGDFKFSINIHNNTDAEDMAALRAEAPSGWEVVFKPSYENKYIGSLKVEPNLSKSVDVEVKPQPGSEIGKYPVTVFSKLSKKELEAKRELTVELTGTYRVQCRTLKDVLSLTAKGGQEANLSMYVINRGTAALNGVTFDSFKPENWKVTFKPERIESIAPGKMEQVEILITPNSDALVGDYSVNVTTRAEKGQDDLELRVTVKPGTTWAWVGVGTIVGVIVLLSVLFKVLGRR
jgi:uncharacterized membrane protein